MLHHGTVQVFICASNIPSSKDLRFSSFPWKTHRSKLSYSHCVSGISICTWRVEFKAAESLLWVLLALFVLLGTLIVGSQKMFWCFLLTWRQQLLGVRENRRGKYLPRVKYCGTFRSVFTWRVNISMAEFTPHVPKQQILSVPPWILNATILPMSPITSVRYISAAQYRISLDCCSLITFPARRGISRWENANINSGRGGHKLPLNPGDFIKILSHARGDRTDFYDFEIGCHRRVVFDKLGNVGTGS